jgi:hypothetical protein
VFSRGGRGWGERRGGAREEGDPCCADIPDRCRSFWLFHCGDVLRQSAVSHILWRFVVPAAAARGAWAGATSKEGSLQGNDKKWKLFKLYSEISRQLKEKGKWLDLLVVVQYYTCKYKL